MAVARGEQFANDCNPACVSGTFHKTVVTVHLYKRRACPGRSDLYYRDATIIDPAGHRTGARISCPYVAEPSLFGLGPLGRTRFRLAEVTRPVLTDEMRDGLGEVKLRPVAVIDGTVSDR